MSLATSLADLRARLGRIVVDRDLDGRWVTAEDLQAAGAMAAVLRDRLGLNLLRTGEGAPALIHTGPFGNVATGCSSVVAARARARRVGGAVTAAGRRLYEPEDDLRTKIGNVAAMYGADGVDYAPAAARFLDRLEDDGYGRLAVVIAKTPLSLSADLALKGAPTGWRLPVREVRLTAGAGYVYAICGSISTMPGLPSHPAAERIDVDVDTGETLNLR